DDVIKTFGSGPSLQSSFELAISNQQQLDIAAPPAFELGGRIKNRIQPIGHPVGTSKYRHQVSISDLCRPPGLAVRSKDIQVAPVRDHGDSLSRHTALANTLYDPRGQAHQPMRRPITYPFKDAHCPEDHRISDHPHRFWQFRPEIPNLENERFAPYPTGENAGDTRRQRSGSRKYQITFLGQSHLHATQGEAEEGLDSIANAVAVGILEIQLQHTNALYHPPALTINKLACQAGGTTLSAATYHSHAVAPLDQFARHGIRTYRTCSFRCYEVLMEIENFHAVIHLILVINSPG